MLSLDGERADIRLSACLQERDFRAVGNDSATGVHKAPDAPPAGVAVSLKVRLGLPCRFSPRRAAGSRLRMSEAFRPRLQQPSRRNPRARCCGNWISLLHIVAARGGRLGVVTRGGWTFGRWGWLLHSEKRIMTPDAHRFFARGRRGRYGGAARFSLAQFLDLLFRSELRASFRRSRDRT